MSGVNYSEKNHGWNRNHGNSVEPSQTNQHNRPTTNNSTLCIHFAKSRHTKTPSLADTIVTQTLQMNTHKQQPGTWRVPPRGGARPSAAAVLPCREAGRRQAVQDGPRRGRQQRPHLEPLAHVAGEHLIGGPQPGGPVRPAGGRHQTLPGHSGITVRGTTERQSDPAAAELCSARPFKGQHDRR